ncbi:ribosomal silencing factor RsfS-like protein, 312 isoform X2 [Tachypleus tridentatus]|uniref:ribosomal silencing factor RsfS-like protein, 312 isoform X2 n=1 Tax=Tachypleus tridentatus TaxID=6853 RepID=UPI003FD40226
MQKHTFEICRFGNRICRRSELFCKLCSKYKHSTVSGYSTSFNVTKNVLSNMFIPCRLGSNCIYSGNQYEGWHSVILNFVKSNVLFKQNGKNFISISYINSSIACNKGYTTTSNANTSVGDHQDEASDSANDVSKLLKNDPELRSILHDIMNDFEPSQPLSTKKRPAKSLTPSNKSVEENTSESRSDLKIDRSREKSASSSSQSTFKKYGLKVIQEPPRSSHESVSFYKMINCGPGIRFYSSTGYSSDKELSHSVKNKFKYFKDEDAEIILDSDEEQQNLLQDSDANAECSEIYLYQEKQVEFRELKLERGETGVFDPEELVVLLTEENMKDIAVIEIPKSICYADYLVIATAKYPRHSLAVAQFIRKLHKKKKNKDDPYLIIEGLKTHDWKAVDMARNRYDIETLWTVGQEYDSQSHQKDDDPVLDLLEQHRIFLQKIKPLHTEEKISEPVRN